ncbi:MAG: hypothetical protein OEY89_02455 [Gammaproteobacteria bacterium]|nr:hypothetical protein [Gammaproteobacteria bacterium]
MTQWVTIDGRKFDVKKMKDQHILSTIRRLEKISTKNEFFISDNWHCEAAIAISPKKWLEKETPYMKLIKEAKRRGI